MSELAREQDALLRALARHGVELVIVGGIAAQLHGWRGATRSGRNLRNVRIALIRVYPFAVSAGQSLCGDRGLDEVQWQSFGLDQEIGNDPLATCLRVGEEPGHGDGRPLRRGETPSVPLP